MHYLRPFGFELARIIPLRHRHRHSGIGVPLGIIPPGIGVPLGIIPPGIGVPLGIGIPLGLGMSGIILSGIFMSQHMSPGLGAAGWWRIVGVRGRGCHRVQREHPRGPGPGPG